VVPREGAAQEVGEGRGGGEAAAGAPLVGAEVDGAPGEAGRPGGEQLGGEAEMEEFGGAVDAAARRDLDRGDAAGRAELVLDDGEIDAEGGGVAEGEAAGRTVAGRRPRKSAQRATASTIATCWKLRSHRTSVPGLTERSKRRPAQRSSVSSGQTPASQAARVPHSTSSTTSAFGHALRPRGVGRRPKVRSLAGVSGRSRWLPSSTTSRRPKRNALGIAGVANGRQSRRKSATTGRAGRRSAVRARRSRRRGSASRRA